MTRFWSGGKVEAGFNRSRQTRLQCSECCNFLFENAYNRFGLLLFPDSLLQDLRYATRMLRKNLAFTTAVIVTVAVGVGVNTTIFTLVDALLLRSLPYRQPDRLVDLNRLPTAEFAQSRVEFLDWKRGSTLLEDAALYTEDGANVTGGLEPIHVQLAQVGASFFRVMGAQPIIGRAFLPEEDIPNSSAVAVISSKLWNGSSLVTRQFWGDLW